MTPEASSIPPAAAKPEDIVQLSAEILEKDPPAAVALLSPQEDETIKRVLELINPATRHTILEAFPRERREMILATGSLAERRQWVQNERYEENTVGRLMEPALAVCQPDATVKEAVERLRSLARRTFIVYFFVVDEAERLTGVVAMREMVLARPDQKLSEILLPNPFALKPEMELTEAMKATLTRHFPVYPVTDATGKLVGVVRGQMLFEAQAIELSAQAGTMVGVEKEERLSTPWTRSLKSRHPWLQLNLVTAFAAAAVVGLFEGTIEKIVVLAVFLPVLAGQSGNTGCQALAVALRGITLGELKPDKVRTLVGKEALLGLCNGVLVGLTAGAGMFVYATMQKTPQPPWMLAMIVCVAMVGSCVLSGISGALVPLGLRRLGADPATASSIFLTTATDVASMGTFLGLATLLLM
jgi:magnesium transporter